MSQLFDRFGRLMRSMVNQPGPEEPDFRDPELREAWEELEDFLSNGEAREGLKRMSQPPEELRPDYELLGIPFGATAEKIEKAYREQLRRYHPDRNMQDSRSEAEATVRTREIIAAYRRIIGWERDEKRGSTP